MTDQTQEPTPLQEMRQAWQDEVAGLKEQIVDAWQMLRQVHDDNEYRSANIEAWLDQNESIVKEAK